MQNNHKHQSNDDGKYKKISIALSIIVILLSAINVYLNVQYNNPTPKLEIAMYDQKTAWITEISQEDMIPLSNGTLFANMSAAKSSTLMNFSCQVYNSGKSAAYGVNVSIAGEPTESSKIISTYVFVGEPLKSNLLDIVGDKYVIGLLPAGKSYVFLFCVQFLKDEAEGKFILTVESENANAVSSYVETH
jgi:hypothetical protein